jgi:hypothetical protein
MMQRQTRLVGAALLAIAVGALLPGSANAQEVVGHTTERADGDALVTFDLSDGHQLVVEVRDGRVFLNGSPVGSAATASADLSVLEMLLDSAEALTTSELIEALRESELQRIAATEVRQALEGLSTGEVVIPEIAEAPAPAALPDPVVVRMRPPRPDVKVAIAEPVTRSSSFVGGLAVGAMTLLAHFIALSFMGLGFLFFVPRQLETIADTVWHSFWRSFLAGLFAQPLIIPVFGAMIVALILTVVGILVVPFAIVGFAMAVVLAAIGGFVAVARTVGEIYLRRKMARGQSVDTWGSYRYIVYGLFGLLAVWLPVVLLGWIPVAGTVLTVSASLITWILATAGFGATIISRAGLRGTFVRQLDLALTDEQFWTDDGMPTQPQHGVARYR